MQPAILTVSQLNAYVKSLLDGDSRLGCVFVNGEISNFKNHYKSGHLYFSLKDAKGVVSSVMFATQASRLRFSPADGMKVLARGRVSLYEASGQYQLYVEDMQPDGRGALHLAFEQTKEKLAREGLFDPERKRPLPEFPERIGVITSPTGAAIHDIRQVLARRYPLAEIVFAPVLVQGEGAPAQLVQALERMNALRCADVILFGRGGGSFEDLWPFNEEAVARAVAASRIPVISAVGHETDVTICDFAADRRAPTPSAAAEMAVPDRQELLGQIAGVRLRLEQLVRAKWERAYHQWKGLAHSRALAHPEELVALEKMRLDALASRLSFQMESRVSRERERLAEQSGRLDTLSPLKVLARGYAVVAGPGGPVTDAAQVAVGDTVSVTLREGELSCRVEKVSQTGRRKNHGGGKKHDI